MSAVAAAGLVVRFDEPTVGLDPTARELIWERVHALLLGGGHPGLDLLVCLAWPNALSAAATAAYPRAIM